MDRRSILVLSYAALFAFFASAQAETGDELVAKNLVARGGADKLAAIHSYVIKGELRLPRDRKLSYTETRLRLDPKTDLCAVRIEASLQGLSLIQAYDGTGGWRVNPFQGRKDPEKIGADDARALGDEALIDGALLAAHTKGSTVEYLGREDVDGTQAYKLRVSEADGTVFTYFLDPDVFLEIKVIALRTVRGVEQETEMDLGDYERVAGVYFPFSIASGPRNSPDWRNITIDAAQANVDLSPEIFAMPAQMAKLSGPN